MNYHLLETLRKQYEEELFKNCIPFWLDNSIDLEHGGIYCCLDRSGKVYATDKSVWLIGRCAWTFSHLCNEYGAKPAWLDMARNSLDFLDKHCIDPTDGRMYFIVTDDGKPLRKRRYFFSECFYMIAKAEYSLAVNDPQAMETARKYFDFVVGMYKDPSSDPFKITPKFISGSRDSLAFANVMILLNATSILRRCDGENAEKYNAISRELLDTMLRGFYNKENGVFMENISPTRGQLFENCPAARLINPGHTIEGSWFMLAEAKHFNDRKLLNTAATIFKSTLARGWDKEYGGLFYFMDLLGYPPEACEHDMKLWWPHTEALIASIMLYEATGEDGYLQKFKMLTDYSFSAFSDPEYGEWYGYLSRNNRPTLPACKGNMFKGPFHLPRMLISVARTLDRLAERESARSGERMRV